MESDRLVTEELIEKVKHELYELGRIECCRRLRAMEPDLAGAIIKAACQAEAQLADTELDETHKGGVVEAVEWCALIAVEAFRRASFELWKDAMKKSMVARIDPDLWKNQK